MKRAQEEYALWFVIYILPVYPKRTCKVEISAQAILNHSHEEQYVWKATTESTIVSIQKSFTTIKAIVYS